MIDIGFSLIEGMFSFLFTTAVLFLLGYILRCALSWKIYKLNLIDIAFSLLIGLIVPTIVIAFFTDFGTQLWPLFILSLFIAARTLSSRKMTIRVRLEGKSLQIVTLFLFISLCVYAYFYLQYFSFSGNLIEMPFIDYIIYAGMSDGLQYAVGETVDFQKVQYGMESLSFMPYHYFDLYALKLIDLLDYNVNIYSAFIPLFSISIFLLLLFFSLFLSNETSQFKIYSYILFLFLFVFSTFDLRGGYYGTVLFMFHPKISFLVIAIILAILLYLSDHILEALLVIVCVGILNPTQLPFSLSLSVILGIYYLYSKKLSLKQFSFLIGFVFLTCIIIILKLWKQMGIDQYETSQFSINVREFLSIFSAGILNDIRGFISFQFPVTLILLLILNHRFWLLALFFALFELLFFQKFQGYVLFNFIYLAFLFASSLYALQSQNKLVFFLTLLFVVCIVVISETVLGDLRDAFQISFISMLLFKIIFLAVGLHFLARDKEIWVISAFCLIALAYTILPIFPKENNISKSKNLEQSRDYLIMARNKDLINSYLTNESQALFVPDTTLLPLFYAHSCPIHALLFTDLKKYPSMFYHEDDPDFPLGRSEYTSKLPYFNSTDSIVLLNAYNHSYMGDFIQEHGVNLVYIPKRKSALYQELSTASKDSLYLTNGVIYFF